MKYCSSCKTDLPLSAFNQNRATKDGLQGWCRKCSRHREDLYRETRREYRRKLNRERYASEEGYRKHINRYFKYTYGITFEEYEALATAQQNNCAICGEQPEEGSRLFVDHCHTTNRVRGLLCFHCNTALGHFRDNTDILKAALNYLYDKK